MQSVWNEKCIISPSLICLDMCNLESQIRILEQSGIKNAPCGYSGRSFQPQYASGTGYGAAAAGKDKAAV